MLSFYLEHELSTTIKRCIKNAGHEDLSEDLSDAKDISNAMTSKRDVKKYFIHDILTENHALEKIYFQD